MKIPLAGEQFETPEHLLSGICDFLSEMNLSEILVVFEHWLERTRWVIQNNGEYYHE
jgi:hypothetical protein